MNTTCCRCCREIESERLVVLPNTTLCCGCAKIVNPKRVKGSMHFAHKTAPVIQIMDADFFDKEWKKYNPSFGRGSGVHKMSPRMAGTG